MPIHNAFRHQTYSSQPPLVPYELHQAPRPSDFNGKTLSLGERLQSAGVERVILVHGTFRGDDALGVVRGMERIIPTAAGWLRQVNREWVDRTARNVGNYTHEYVRRFSDLVRPGAPSLCISRFVWSGENHHVGRADAAVRLIDHLLHDRPSNGGRVLLWGHSHAGNVFALMTNLLAGPAISLEQFFEACQPLFWSSQVSRVDRTRWQRVQQWLYSKRDPADSLPLDIVTFGTPIRYGWETRGYHQLLHLVHHRPIDGLPEYRARFPFSWDEARTARGGDYMQQLGIAGTDFPPSLVNWRAMRVESSLRRLLQAGFRRRDVMQWLKFGVRLADEGTVLLINYPDDERHQREQLLGHGIYTSPDWLAYHLELVTNHFYAAELPVGRT
jgi:hypothetical protein